jgi:hypothetical protein
MKQFNSLLEGLNYHIKCPACQGAIDIADDKHRALMSEINLYHNNEQVLLCYELIDGDLVIIDKRNDDIDFIIRNNLNYNYHTNSFALTLECYNREKNRCLFGYELLCRFDSINHKLYDICLVSEQFSIENKENKLCLIKSNYQENYTKYTTGIFSSPGLDGKSIKIPLVDIDFKNIKKTMEKIENLLVFS